MIGNRIRMARKRSGYTQEQLAYAINVSPQYISDLERGISGASVDTIIKICMFLQVSSDYILLGNDTAGKENIILHYYEHLEPKNQEFLRRMTHVFSEALSYWVTIRKHL